jgi:AcrR family transcriptional regulator
MPVPKRTNAAGVVGSAVRVPSPRARMQATMLATVMRLMQSGIVPSVSDVAEAAHVSRATAYRYFPSQAVMIQAAVNEALRSVLTWTTQLSDARERVDALFSFSYPLMLEQEALHRAALLLALEQWTRKQAGTLRDEARIIRGNRKVVLRTAVAPLADQLPTAALDRLAKGLSLLFGIEPIVILKDIWGLDNREAGRVATWAARALVNAAIADSEEKRMTAPLEIQLGALRSGVSGKAEGKRRIAPEPR